METRDRHWFRVAFAVTSWLFVVLLLVQVLLVGLSIFSGQALWALHRDLGHMFGLLLILMLVLAFVSRAPRRVRVETGALFAVYIVQAEIFAAIRGVLPNAAALHPVLALVLFWLSVTVALGAWRLLRADSRSDTAQLPVPESVLQ